MKLYEIIGKYRKYKKIQVIRNDKKLYEMKLFEIIGNDKILHEIIWSYEKLQEMKRNYRKL